MERRQGKWGKEGRGKVEIERHPYGSAWTRGSVSFQETTATVVPDLLLPAGR